MISNFIDLAKEAFKFFNNRNQKKDFNPAQLSTVEVLYEVSSRLTAINEQTAEFDYIGMGPDKSFKYILKLAKKTRKKHFKKMKELVLLLKTSIPFMGLTKDESFQFKMFTNFYDPSAAEIEKHPQDFIHEFKKYNNEQQVHNLSDEVIDIIGKHMTKHGYTLMFFFFMYSFRNHFYRELKTIVDNKIYEIKEKQYV